MKPAAFLDLSIFAVPNSLKNVGELDRLFDQLEAWSERVGRQNCITIVISDDAIDTLEAANCFPATHNIQALLEMFQLEHVFSARDINKRIFKILGQAAALGEVTGVRIDACDATCDASEALREVSEVLLESAHKLGCALGVFVASQPAVGDLIAVVPGFQVERDVLTVEAKEIAAHIKGQGDVALQNLISEIRICDLPTQFVNGLSPERVWECAETGAELALPIALRAAQKLDTEIANLPLTAGRAFSIGEHFYNSLEEVEALRLQKHASTSLDRCAAVVADNTLQFERDFGKKRRADNAGSRRVHVTKKGIGLRLMFWELPSGQIEFANIGPKHEEAIFEGNPNQAFAAVF
jgi:hypothetical protein